VRALKLAMGGWLDYEEVNRKCRTAGLGVPKARRSEPELGLGGLVKSQATTVEPELHDRGRAASSHQVRRLMPMRQRDTLSSNR
jgi:hypothetical protein